MILGETPRAAATATTLGDLFRRAGVRHLMRSHSPTRQTAELYPWKPARTEFRAGRGNASPAPQPTAKPYGTDCRHAAPTRCCREHSHRVARRRLAGYVRSLTRR
jgi:hypothetical protein